MRRDEALKLRLDGFTYTQIGKTMGISRQRAQQLLSPPRAVRALVVERAQGKCEDCGIHVSRSGHVHHIEAQHGDVFDAVNNLQLLCPSCHRLAHGPGMLPSKETSEWAKRSIEKKIRVNEAQWEQARRAAASVRLHLSEWLRQAIAEKLANEGTEER